MLRFSDGVNIDTSGALRVLRLADGYYVVGQGMSIPCRDAADAEATLAKSGGLTMHSEFITLLGLNASRGMTIGHWRLFVDENAGSFYWARPDDAQHEPTWPLIWATPYHEGSRGIVVQVQD